ncbi:MAG: hypothetical protein WC742_10615 [Gallionellaceae bacterium]
MFFSVGSASNAYADEWSISYGMGTRTDALRWAIAADLAGSLPNIMSELTWRDLNGAERSIGLIYESTDNWMARALYQEVDFTHSGEVQDSDYNTDNRTGEYSRSLSATRGSSALSITTLIGPLFFLNDEQTLIMTPLLGFAHQISDLRMNNGVQIIDTISPQNVGPFSGLNSSYRAQFDSRIAGIETRWWLTRQLGIEMQWQHQWFNYRAEADWNKRSEFQHPLSFYQNGLGENNQWTLKLLAKLNRHWEFDAAYTQTRGGLQNGRDVSMLANGAREITRLNEVDFASTALSMMVKYTF